MASTKAPEILILLADAAISKGHAVKIGSDSEHVAKAVLGTDLQIGIAQNAASALGDAVEVAVMGGAKGLAGGSITAGSKLTATTTGALVATTSANDQVVGIALDGAASGDLFDVLVYLSNY